MSERNTTWLRFGLAVIASVYAVFGAAYGLQSVYAVLISGTEHSTPSMLDSLIPLFIAFGLFTLRPWARILAVVVSGFMIFVGVAGLLLCVAHLFGFVQAASGLIVDRPGLAVGILFLIIAFAAWQWWVLTRPAIQAMFCASVNRP
jgi:hypothetical protein